MRIEVIRTTAEGADAEQVEVPPGATVAEAIAVSRFARANVAALAVYGRVVTPDRILEEGDRIELLRDLLTDPKEARRIRAATRSDSSAE